MEQNLLWKRLGSMSSRELTVLASELRRIITETVAANGGHLSSNLGTVELTIALYRVFDPESDYIIWDTGHQAYAHKLLTGRYDSFHSLRRMNGISGFLRRSESPFDVFGAGHVGTAIAAGLGIEAALQKGSERSVVAVVGDGAMTSGNSLEALNQIDHLKSSIKVVLNDNGMSISKNVGRLSSVLNEMRLKRLYRSIKGDVKDTLELMRLDGVESVISRIKTGLKQTILGANLFEDMGLNYIGPVDGHDIKELESVFAAVKDFAEPFLVHVVTNKGRGVDYAERDSITFHSIGSFDPETGDIHASNQISYSEVFGETMKAIAEKDSRVCGITAAMPDGTGLSVMSRKFPERVHDLGITEQLCATYAAGMATQGMKPVFAVYSTFLQRAFDQVIHDICIQRLPVLFCVDRAGIVGNDGPTHNGVFDIAFLSMTPNMTVLCPSSLQDLADTLYTLLLCEELKGPIAVRYPRCQESGDAASIVSMMKRINLHRWQKLVGGRGIAVLATGSMVAPAVKAGTDEEAAVFDCRSVKPLDEQTLLSLARNFDAIVTIEEGILHGGFGSSVTMALNEIAYEGIVRNIGIDDCFSDHGSRNEILSLLSLDYTGLRRQIRKIRGELCAHNHRIRKD